MDIDGCDMFDCVGEIVGGLCEALICVPMEGRLPRWARWALVLFGILVAIVLFNFWLSTLS